MPRQRYLAVLPVRPDVDEVTGALHHDRRDGRIFTTMSAERAQQIYKEAVTRAVSFGALQRFTDHLGQADKRVMFVFPQKAQRAKPPSSGKG